MIWPTVFRRLRGFPPARLNPNKILNRGNAESRRTSPSKSCGTPSLEFYSPGFRVRRCSPGFRARFFPGDGCGLTNRWRRAGDRGHMGFTEQVFCLRSEDPSRSSEAGRRKTSEPASPPVEAPGWDEPVAVREREATCGTSCQDLGGTVPPGRRAKIVDMTLYHPMVACLVDAH